MDTGVEIDLESLFKLTAASHIPDLINLMKAEDKDTFEVVFANVDKTKNKVQCYALLTPMFSQAIHNCDMLPAAIFVKIIESIKVSAVFLTTNMTTVEEYTGASTSTSSSNSCTDRTPPLTTTTPTAAVKAPTIATLEDNATIAWDKITKEECIPAPKKVTLDVTETSTFSSTPDDGAIFAMKKLSTCMIKHQEAELRFKEDKSDTSLKAWKKIPKIQ